MHVPAEQVCAPGERASPGQTLWVPAVAPNAEMWEECGTLHPSVVPPERVMMLRRFLSSYSHLFVAGTVGLVAGCGSDDSPTPGADVGVGSGADAGAAGDVGAVLPPCVTSADCAGGQFCSGGVCQEACSEEDPCTGALGACDLATGVCVECLADVDCAGGQRCVTASNTCVSFCVSDADCPGGRACIQETGVCVEVECTTDADCAGGESCEDRVCVPIVVPGTCEAGETRCEGNVLQTCRADGSGFRDRDCGTETCVQDSAGARCVAQGCVPNEVGCVDSTTAYLCDPFGGSFEEFDCGAGQTCEDGVCRGQICEPSEVTCDGDALVVCNETGSAQSAVTCDDTPACQGEELGCSCLDGECEPRVCAPGSRSCVGPGYRECTPDGLAFLAVVNCDEGEECRSGRCLPTSCTGSGTYCDGDVVVGCSAGTVTAEDCAADEQVCTEDLFFGASCSDRVCEPGSSRCSAGGSAVLRCSGTGASETRIDCAESQTCVAGACVAQACTPGTRECRGTEVWTCNAGGSAYQRTATCGAGQVCSDGSCVADDTGCRSNTDCPPPAASCDGNVLVTYSGNGTCSGGVCSYSPNRRTCSADTFCDAPARTCSEVTVGSCSSDAECEARAEALGFTGDVACDSVEGCYAIGRCGAGEDLSEGALDDPFGSGCRGAQTCAGALDLITVGTVYRCTGCDEDGDDCRDGEECRMGLFDAAPTCQAPGGGFPFPFP